jgi:hypothetical protein
VATEAIIRIQTQIAIIILAQDVTMDIVVAIMQGLGQALIQAVIQTHRLNRQRHGEIIVIQVPLQHSPHQVVVLRMEVHHLAVHHRVEEVLQVAEVEVEGQDKINKTLTIKIPSHSNLRGFFRLKYRGIVIFNCHICRKILILYKF